MGLPSLPFFLQHPLQERRCGGTLRFRNFLRRAVRDETPSRVAAFGAQLDEVIGVGENIEMMLDHDDRVARIDELMQDAQEPLHVGEVQPDGRLLQ